MISLNSRDAKPIYAQLKDGIRHLIAVGGLEAGEMLPSVRELAAKLTINPQTIARAYRELEEEGYLCTREGEGFFVAEKNHAATVRTGELLQTFDALVQELVFLSVPKEELIGRVAQLQVQRSEHD